MAFPSADRLACRIVEETRLARLARHPRARIAHYMLADAYRALVNRLLLDDGVAPAEQANGSHGLGVRYFGLHRDRDTTGSWPIAVPDDRRLRQVRSLRR